MAKYTLKQKPQAAQEGSWIQNRHKPPQAPSWISRLGRRLKRLVVGCCVICTVLAASLAIPFHRWDNEPEMTAIREALTALQKAPGSQNALSALHTVVHSRETAPGRAVSERPGESWHQALQRQRYDVYFGASETLGLGLVQAGFPDKGFAVLKKLHNQEDLTQIPKFAGLIRTCSACKNGYLEEKCKTCQGTGKIELPNPPKKFPLTATLRDTRKERASKQPPNSEGTVVQYTCNVCRGTGKVETRCPACSGRVSKLLPDRVQSLFTDTLRATVSATQRHKSLLRFINVASSMQRKALKKGQETLDASAHFGGKSFEIASLFPLDSDSGDKNVGTTPSTVTERPSSGPAQPPEDESLSFVRALRDACEEKIKSGSDTPDFQRMLAEAVKAHNEPAIQCCAMSVFGLGLLAQRNTNGYSRVVEIQKNKFADSPFRLSIAETDYLVACPSCRGQGTKSLPCPMCTGPNACPVCKGTRLVKMGNFNVPCEKCRNRAPCAQCKGTTKIMSVCPECLGHRKRLQIAGAVSDAYTASLSNLIAQCSARLDAAAPEPQSGASDMPPKEVASSSTEKPHISPTSEPVVAMSENEGPVTDSRKQKNDRASLYIWGLALLLAGAVVLVLRAKRKARTGLSRLPGMDKIDASRFTDPLSLTAQDSLTRTKHKTARIPFEKTKSVDEAEIEDAETRIGPPF